MTRDDLPRRVLTCYRSDRPGGFATRFKRMMLVLAEAGVEVHCVCESVFPVEHPRIQQHVLSSPFDGKDSLAAWAWFFFRNPSRLARLARSIGPDAVVVFSGTYAWLLGRAARSLGVPLLSFCRLRPGFSSRRTETLLERRGYRSCDCVAAQSRATCDFIADRMAVSRDRLLVLPNEVPAIEAGPEARATARKRLARMADLPEDALVAVYTGRLAAVKRADTLLLAMAKLQDERLRLLLIGDGPERGGLEQAGTDLGLSGRAFFCGWQRNVVQLLPGADVYLSASSLEGAPNAMLEAMGAGLPCLAADIPEVREVLEHEELLFPVGDAEALAAKLSLAVSGSERLAHLRRLSMERAQAYSFDWNERLLEVLAKMYERAKAE